MTHKGMDQSAPRVFGVGGDTGNAAHVHNLVMYIYLHGVDNDHRRKPLSVKPSQHKSLLQNRAFRVLDLVLLPAGLKQIIGGNLKSVLKQGVKLLQIAFVQLTHPKVAADLKINMFLIFFFHKDHLS